MDEQWIVLVDVSASLDQIDRHLSREVGNPLYRLRNELLSLLQVFLGAMDDVDARRNGYLKVEFFGQGVEAASDLPTWPLHWEDAKNEDWWNASVPNSLSGRTELMPALQRAAEDFAGMSPLSRKRLLIVSDGELDVGSLDRGGGVSFRAEERQAYAELMSPDNTVVEKLRSLKVKVDAIAIDSLAAPDGPARQDAIRRKLLSTGESTIQKQFQKLLDELESEINSKGRQPFSEGPYFLHALTETLGGQSRPVHAANLAEVVGQTVFPEAAKSGNVAPGSRWLVVLAKADKPVRLSFDNDGAQQELILRYDRQKNEYYREPKDTTADIRVRYHATSRYVTWLINAPGVICVDPPAAHYGNNVELRWSPPEERISSGRALPIELELTRWLDEGPSLEWWRMHLSRSIDGGSVKAIADVSLPDGSRALGIPLEVKPATGADAVVVLKGQLSGAAAHGSYVVSARLMDVEQGWEETIEPTTLEVAPATWWPSRSEAPRVAMAVGALVCFSLLFVYRQQLKDFSFAPEAPFDFAIQSAGNTTFTDSGHRKAIRFRASEGGICIDLGRRGAGSGPTAIFIPADRSSLSYRLYAKGRGWEYRQNHGEKVSEEYIPLGEMGIEISFLDFVQRSSVDLRHGDHVVRISHSSYIS